jgi:hypothetical protein
LYVFNKIMIRSGLANVQKSGYKGYPNERDPDARKKVERPFAAVGDETVLQKTDYSDPMANPITVPEPIMYNDIFAKRTTPDERVYVLKQIQQGLEKIQKGILGKESAQVKPLPLPRQPGDIIEILPARRPVDPPVPTTDGSVEPAVPATGTINVLPGLLTESSVSPDSGQDLEFQEEAQDVVANPPAGPSLTEQERAAEEWLHMQHSPQWRQIEGRPFNSALTSVYHTASSGASSGSWRGPDSSGSYAAPSPRYPTLPPLYPELDFTPSTDSPSLSPQLTEALRSANSTEGLDILQREIHGYPLEVQREFFRGLSEEQRENVGLFVIEHPTHPITREPVFQAEIPLFSAGTSRGSTLSNSTGYLTAGTSNSYSSITSSSRSLSSSISSNGVGPRRRNSAPITADSRMSVPMSVDTPPISRRNPPPPPINTQLPAQRDRSPTNYNRRNRPQVLADVERQLQHGLRPRRRRNYYESPPS